MWRRFTKKRRKIQKEIPLSESFLIKLKVRAFWEIVNCL